MYKNEYIIHFPPPSVARVEARTFSGRLSVHEEGRYFSATAFPINSPSNLGAKGMSISRSGSASSKMVNLHVISK